MAEIIAAAERLLDLQILDTQDHPLGKVDDLELTLPDDGGPPYLTGLLCGPLAFGPRLGGRLGLWWQRTGARLRPEADPRPVRIDFGLVTVEPTSLRVATPDPAAPPTPRLEGWLREHLIGRIPGAR